MSYEPTLTASIRRTGTLDHLDGAEQSRLSGVISRCALIALGRAVVHDFEPLTDVAPGRTFIGDSQLRCVGGHPSARSWIAALREARQDRSLTDDEMTSIATTLYMCARDYLVDGPLASGLDVRRSTAACVASRLASGSGPLPEVVRIMFGQGGRKRSATLAQLISECGG